MKDLYVIQSDVTGALKIGVSKNPNKRLKQLQTGSPYKLKLVGVFKGMAFHEKPLHSRLKPYKLSVYYKKTQGEWFDFDCMGNLPDWITESLDLDIVNTWWCEHG